MQIDLASAEPMKTDLDLDMQDNGTHFTNLTKMVNNISQTLVNSPEYLEEVDCVPVSDHYPFCCVFLC